MMEFGAARLLHFSRPLPTGWRVAALLILLCAGAREVSAGTRFVFEENRGQAPAAVRFVANSGGMRVAVEDGAFAISTRDVEPAEWVRFSFIGANPRASVHGERRLAGVRNYLLGNDPALWITDVATWDSVRIEQVYPGIDVLFRRAGENLEYDFVLAPGANPELIAIQAVGTTRLEAVQGSLIASVRSGESIVHLRPLAFQAKPHARVTSAWRLSGNEMRFAVGRYDRSRELTIDPEIAVSTYLGGTSIDKINAVTVDAAGNIYLAGETYSTDYPFVNGVQSTNKSAPSERDAFITKLDPSGRNVIFSTYFGGKRGREMGQAIAVDAAGAIYVAGPTYSTDLPVSADAFQKEANEWVGTDGFLVKLSPSGNAIAYCTYLAARSSVPSTEDIHAIAVDSGGNAVVAGESTDPSWPVTAGAYRTAGCGGFNDAFVSKVNARGSGLIYSTYLCGAGTDWAYGLRLDAAGNAYIAGRTTSRDFPLVGVAGVELHGPSDAWVAKLDPSGSTLIRSTLVGGGQSEVATSIAIDANGNVYIAGDTDSPDLPAHDGYQHSYAGSPEACFDFCGDAFVARLGSDFQLLSATYLGGTNEDQIAGVAVTSAGVVVVGTTVSTNFPLVSPLQSTFGGKRDMFVATFDSTLRSLGFSTFYGGNEWDVALGLAADTAGAVYAVGFTRSTNLTPVNDCQTALAGSFDGVLVKLSAPPSLPPRRRAVRH